MTALLSLPQVQTGLARKPDSRVLLPLEQYDNILVSFSGGKDSLALVLDLLERGVDRDRIQLWHQDVDGEHGSDEPFVDWPCTRSYVRAVGAGAGLLPRHRAGFYRPRGTAYLLRRAGGDGGACGRP
jgi:hypothetical protein